MLMRPPADPFHERLVASYPQIRRFLPQLIEAVAMESTAPARAVLDAYRALGTWLADKPHTTRLADTEIPMDVVSASWEAHVGDRQDGTVNRAAYACCVLDRLRVGLRRRDVYAPGSIRWGDPRAELLSPDTWEQQRDQACEDLALDTDPAKVVANLDQVLDEAWTRAAGGMATNPDLPTEHRDGADRVVVTPLDAIDEPASLVRLWPWSRRSCPRSRSPTCPWKSTAGRGSSTSTPASAVLRRGPIAWPSRSPRSSWPTPATSASPRSSTTTTRR